MAYKISFLKFLSTFLSFSNCLKGGFFRKTKIELYENSCNEAEGNYRFLIRGAIDSTENAELYLLYISLESPPNTYVICLIDFNLN